MSTGANNPDNAPNADETVSPTTITVSGDAFELRGLSAEEGARLYAALPPNYQTLADSYAALAKQFERPIDIDLPPGTTMEQAWQDFVNAPRTAGGKLLETAAPHLKQIEEHFKDTPILGQIYGAADETGEALDFAGGMIQAGKDLLMVAPRLLNLGWSAAEEGAHAAIPPISDAQARAFGAAYAGAVLHEGAAREAMPLIDSPINNVRSLAWSFPIDASLAGMEYASLKWPLVKDVWPMIAGFTQWAMQAIGNIGKDGAVTPSLSDTINQVKQEIATRYEGADTSYRGLLEGRLRTADIGRAERRMLAAETIAGVDTKERTEAVANGGAFIAENGNLAAARPGPNGEVNITPITTTPPGSQGPGQPPGPTKEISRWDRLVQQAGNLGGVTGRNLFDGEWKPAEDAPGIAGVIGTALAAIPFTEGFRGARIQGAERNLTNIGKNLATAESRLAATRAAQEALTANPGASAGMLNRLHRVAGALPFISGPADAASLAADEAKYARRVSELTTQQTHWNQVVEHRTAGAHRGFFGIRATEPLLANTGNNLKGLQHTPGIIIRQVGGTVGLIGNGLQHATGNTIAGLQHHGSNMVANAKDQGRAMLGAPQRFADSGRNFVNGIAGMFGRREAAVVTDVADAASPATRAAAQAAESTAPARPRAPNLVSAAGDLPHLPANASTARVAAEAVEGAGRFAGTRRWLAGAFRPIPKIGKPLSVLIGGTLVAVSVNHAAEAREQYSVGNENDGNAKLLDAASLLTLWAGPTLSIFAEEQRLEAISDRAARVPNSEALALIELIGNGRVDNDELRKLQVLKNERAERLAEGRSLEVNITIRSDGKRILAIGDAQEGSLFMGDGGPVTYNANLNEKLLQEAKLYLGSHGTLEHVAQMMGIAPEQLAAVRARHPRVQPTESDAGLAAAIVDTTQRTEQRQERRERQNARPAHNPLDSIGEVAQAGHRLVERSVTAGIGNARQVLDSLPKLPHIDFPRGNLFG